VQPLRVLWFVPPPVALLAEAVSPGEVEGKLNRSSDEQFDALAAGTCDAVVTAMDNVFAWNRRVGPRDFQIVAQIERTTPLSLIGSKVKDFAALRGATILVDAPENGFVIALRAMLADAGIPPDAYSLQEVGGVKARLDGLLAGHGDATLLGPPFDGMAMAAGMSLLGRVQAAYPQFPGQGLIVRRHTLEARGPQLRAWLRSLEAARTSALETPQSSLEIIAAAGFPSEVAGSMLANLPANLRPDRTGVELLIGHRRQLHLPGAGDTYESLVSNVLLVNEEEMK
jgi:ABC-type nitrate/sulfonate/bicarbonate transport system substrate-binding protein